MKRLAIYVDDFRFELAYWDGDKQLITDGHESHVNGANLLEAHLPARSERQMISDFVVFNNTFKPGTFAPLKSWITRDMANMPKLRMAGTHPREKPLFGWARTVALRDRVPTSTAMLVAAHGSETIRYELRSDSFEHYQAPLRESARRFVNDDGIKLALLLDDTYAGAIEPSLLPTDLRQITCLPEKGALALGLLHSDIVLQENAALDAAASDSDIASSFATLMDTVFDSITHLGYDLDDAICTREIEVVDNLTNTIYRVEAKMRISRSEIIDQLARTHSIAAKNLILKRAIVTGVVEPQRPDGSAMIELVKRA